ncbi:heterogeneous nuclear ribonucleoprotein U-like protein 2 [Cydia amplana]|uniref:heterogeneous nuclear ribonucleoprotein U-like protein 2 n=1 Tax=Cydia amplana TaxID=1869771 RepID=UPI002FE58A22
MDPAKMKVVDLRSELGALGLDTKGNKPALVERLKKALEAKSGKAIADTTILDTSTEDADEPSTPRRAGPAARTRRRSSSTRVASTPAKVARVETPEPIVEEPKSEEPEPEPEPQREPSPEPSPESSPDSEPEPVQPAPVPVPAPEPEMETEPEPQAKPQVEDSEMYSIDDERSQSPVPQVKSEEPMEQEADGKQPAEDGTQKEAQKMEEDGEKTEGEDKKAVDGEESEEAQERQRELTEEEEWEQLNERLQQKEKERLEREKKQAEEDAKRLEEFSKDPVKLNRLKRKQEKKARWSNFYKAVEVTNEVLTPPVEESRHRKKSESSEAKVVEPELNDNKLTLSWYDSDLNQYLELPELVSVVPLSDGAFAHAWAGARGSHGVSEGRLCFELRVGDAVTTTETTGEKEVISNGLRVGWSTDDSSLHLGEGELSFGYENTGRAVNNGEFKEYGKTFSEKDVIGVYLDLESSPCKVSYTLNGAELGAAHEFDRAALGGRALFPHVLTKNICYRVNFGHDQYNMLTKTKIVRKRLEIPIEQVLEEKRVREEEIQRQKEEVARKEKERKEKEKKEREERQRQRREERERQERERKEKEAQERKEKGEEEKPAEGDKDGEEEKKQDEPKENGDKPEEGAEVKQEPMETEVAPEPEPAKETPAEAKETPAEAKETPAEAKQTPADAKETPAEAKETPAEAKETPAEAKEDVKEEPAPEGPVPEVTEEQVLKGLTLDKRIKFVTRFTVEQELDGPEACLLPGYVFIAHAQLVDGPRRPASKADCEVILMVGMPGAGKTHWVRAHVAAHPERRYNVLSTQELFHRMQVDCKPFRDACEGRWDAMVSKGAKCVLKLLEFAHGRRRNYILDQTNVYPSAQRRKLREFDGYRRVAVVVVPDADTYAERSAKREQSDGKEVPDGAIMDMKANFALPEKCSWIDELIYPELNEEEAKKILEGFHKEAKAAGVVKEREKRDRSSGRDAPPQKRPRSGDRRHGRDDRRKDFSREREDRWGGGGGGGGNSRWGPSSRGGGGGGGGGRWGGPRDRPGPPQGRFDRPWGGRDNGGPPFNRDRDGFRGGRGGSGGPGGPGGPPGMRGDRGPRQDQRFGGRPDNRGGRPMDNKRPGEPPGPLSQGGGGGGGGGGAGSWQRGGGAGAGGRGGAGRGGQLQRAGPQGKDSQQGQQAGNQQQGWNQWANQQGWGNWGNWNQQNQAAWGNWQQNWNNWSQQQGQQAGAGAAKAQAAGAAGQQATQQQWQQWYQWQQWQQQQGWPGYQQGQQQAGQTGQDQQAQWAQYYQNYGANAAGNAITDKK